MMLSLISIQEPVEKEIRFFPRKEWRKLIQKSGLAERYNAALC
jgi:hypothetical protein